ncbi:MAG: outer membrane protein assembly factor BamD [Thermodesulfobacteriota bacterium]
MKSIARHHRILSWPPRLLLLLCASLLILLPGCSVYRDIASMFSDGDTVQAAPESLAMDAMDEFNRGEYSSALKLFEEIQERFPFSRFSLMAELKSADCHYHLGHYGEAIVSYEGFAKNHPTNEALPYVLFQLGMCYYMQIDTIDRDPGHAFDAQNAFSKLLTMYPQSPYTEEAKAKIRVVRDFLAGHEMYVATFYLKTNKIEQSKARLRYLLDNYPDSAEAPHAQEILAKLEAGQPIESSWLDWIPEIGLPDWATFQGFGSSSTPAPQQ